MIAPSLLEVKPLFAALAYKARGTAVDAFLRRRAPVPLPRGCAPID